MKLAKRIISALLLASMLLAYAAGCASDNNAEDALTDDPAIAEASETKIDLTGYTIVRSDNSDSGSPASEAAVALRKYLNGFGLNIGITTDFVNFKRDEEIPTSAHEILIGSTNRAPSVSAVSGLGKYDYTVKTEGDFIVIAGGSDTATANAIAAFIAEYDKNGGITSDLNLSYTFRSTDNSALMPKYVSDEFVTLEPCEPGGDEMTPDWAKSLILMEVHLETATPEGTFQSAVKVLDHCAEMGVNGIWLTPIYEKGPGGNGYGNIGPHSVEPALTGTSDYEEGWKVVRDFVDEAHKRNIRVLFDIVTWGTVSGAPLFKEHPDWYKGKAWGNEAFNWRNTELIDWFVDVCVDNIIKTGADGYRCDCEPNYTGYRVFNKVREKCLEAGRKILVMAEDGANRKDTYDIEQDGVLWYGRQGRAEQYHQPLKWYIDELDIVSSIKKGKGIGSQGLQDTSKGGRFRYYTFCVSNHDYQQSITNANRLVIGYQAIFSPFIPLWYFGAEFGQRASNVVIYDVKVDWSLLDDPDNLYFYEDLKRYIAIRRSYPEIFEYFPEDHREANICGVDVEGGKISSYARYADGKAILIVPNNNGETLNGKVTIPVSECGLSSAPEYVEDLLNGTRIPVSDGAFEVTVEDQYIGVYLAQ